MTCPNCQRASGLEQSITGDWSCRGCGWDHRAQRFAEEAMRRVGGPPLTMDEIMAAQNMTVEQFNEYMRNRL